MRLPGMNILQCIIQCTTPGFYTQRQRHAAAPIELWLKRAMLALADHIELNALRMGPVILWKHGTMQVRNSKNAKLKTKPCTAAHVPSMFDPATMPATHVSARLQRIPHHNQSWSPATSINRRPDQSSSKRAWQVADAECLRDTGDVSRSLSRLQANQPPHTGLDLDNKDLPLARRL